MRGAILQGLSKGWACRHLREPRDLLVTVCLENVERLQPPEGELVVVELCLICHTFHPDFIKRRMAPPELGGLRGSIPDFGG